MESYTTYIAMEVAGNLNQYKILCTFVRLSTFLQPPLNRVCLNYSTEYLNLQTWPWALSRCQHSHLSNVHKQQQQDWTMSNVQRSRRRVVVAITKVKFKVKRCRRQPIAVVKAHLIQWRRCHGDVRHEVAQNAVTAYTRLFL